MLSRIARFFVSRAERRIGVPLDYVHAMAEADLGLLRRYNRIFGMLDGNTHAPPLAYHTARLRGAAIADCGTCKQAEENLARAAGLDTPTIDRVLSGSYDALPEGVAAVAELTDAVVGERMDHPEARDRIRAAFGERALIEISFAVTGAALLPGIKRAMGYAQVCTFEPPRQRSA